MMTSFSFFVPKDAIHHCPSSPDAGGNDCCCGERNFDLYYIFLKCFLSTLIVILSIVINFSLLVFR